MSIEKTVISGNEEMEICYILDQLEIEHEVEHHLPAHSILECTDILESLGNGGHCKNLFLCNRQKTEFYLLLIRPDKKFRTAEVSQQIGKARLGFAEESFLEQYLHIRPGAVSPLGLVYDREKKVTLLIDCDLLKKDYIYFHPCVNTASVRMTMADFTNRFLPYTGHEPVYIEADSGEKE